MGKMKLFAGPCVLESELDAAATAQKISHVVRDYNVDYYFKASFDKANRSSANAWRGEGMLYAKRVFGILRKDFEMKVITDIHEPWQVEEMVDYVDAFQIPAFLCRQTDLLHTAVDSGKLINIKKGQFVSPQAALSIYVKALDLGAKKENLLMCERGHSFGYDSLVVDFAGIATMAKTMNVCMDCTHCSQENKGSYTGGNNEYAELFAESALLWGATSLFFEVHPSPGSAMCDVHNQIQLDKFLLMIQRLCRNHASP